MDISSIVATKKDSESQPPDVLGNHTENTDFENILLTISINAVMRLTLLVVCHLKWVRNYEC